MQPERITMEQLSSVTSNKYVNQVMLQLCKTLFSRTSKNIGKLIMATETIIGVLEKFDDFSENKENIIMIKDIWYEAFQKNGNQSTLKLSVALGTILNAYEKKNAHYLDFKQAILAVIGILRGLSE